MIDLVKRLRQGSYLPLPAVTMHEAANEIEKLRTAVKESHKLLLWVDGCYQGSNHEKINLLALGTPKDGEPANE